MMMENEKKEAEAIIETLESGVEARFHTDLYAAVLLLFYQNKKIHSLQARYEGMDVILTPTLNT